MLTVKGGHMIYARLFWTLLALVLLPNTLFAEAPLTISGCSVSNVGYLNDLAKAYETETGKKVLVRGGGSIVGLTELGADKIDLAASCLGKTRKTTDFTFTPVAWDALVFIVNRSNRLSSITPDQIRAIYDGTIFNWKQLGGADLKLVSYISTPEGFGGIGEALEKYLLDGKRPQKQSNSSMQASSASIWEQLVEKVPEGFASTGFGSARKRKVKMLAINGVLPTKKSIVSGAYPYKRHLYLVTTKDAPLNVRKFVEFAISRKGQTLISSYGIPALGEIR